MNFIKEFTELVFIEDAPKPADIIFIPGSGYGQIALDAAKLYHQGLAPYILVSGKYSKLIDHFDGVKDGVCSEFNGTTEAEYLKYVLMSSDVPEDTIIVDNDATFTYENAICSRKITDALGLSIQRAIICCQAFHARRCRLYYEILYPETEFLMCPTVTQGISRDNWFESKEKIDIVLGEIERWGGQFHEIMYEHIKKSDL